MSRIVEQARKALDVRFRHQGRSPVEGLDCIGLVIWTMRELGLSDYDYGHYAAIPADAAPMTAELERLMERIPLEQAKEGDVLRFNMAGVPLHVGIKTDIGVIHALSTRGKVVEHRLDEKWGRRVIEAWRIKEKGVGNEL